MAHFLVSTPHEDKAVFLLWSYIVILKVAKNFRKTFRSGHVKRDVIIQKKILNGVGVVDYYYDLLCLIVNRIKMRVNPHSRQIHARKNNRITKSTLCNIFRVTSRNPILSFLFFPGPGPNWSRDTIIWFLTSQENYRLFRGCRFWNVLGRVVRSWVKITQG